VRAGLLIIVLVIIVLWTIRRPFVGALAITVCMVIRDTMYYETYGYFYVYHSFEVLYIATIVSVIIAHPDRLVTFVPKSMTDWGMLGFMAAMVISALVNGVSIFGHKYIDLFFKAVVLYFLLSRLADTPRRLVLVALAIIVACSYEVYLAWSQYRSGEMAWARPYFSTPIHTFGQVLVMTLPLIGALLAWRVWLPIRLVLFGLIPLYVITTLRTTSRSAMLGVGFGLAMLAWYHRKRWYWLVPGIPFVAYAIVHNPESVIARMESIWTHKTETGAKDGSIQMRFEQMRTAKNVIASSPLFGIGPRQFFRRYLDFAEDQTVVVGGKYTMHSVPLLILCEEGFIGGFMYGLIVLGTLLDAWYAVRMTRGDPVMEVAGIIGAGGLMCFLAFLAYSLGQPGMWLANIYVTVALASAARRTVEARLAAQAVEERRASPDAAAAWIPRAATTEIAFS